MREGERKASSGAPLGTTKAQTERDGGGGARRGALSEGEQETYNTHFSKYQSLGTSLVM